MSFLLNKLYIASYHTNTKWIILTLVSAIFTGIVLITAIHRETWLYITIFFIPLLIYLCIEKPFIFPFGLYIFLLPFDEILAVTSSGQGATLTKLLGILTIIVFMLKGLFEKNFKKPDVAAVWLLLFIMYCASSIVWAIDPALGVTRLITIIGLTLLYLVLSLYRLNEKELGTIKWFILAGGLMAALYLLYTYFTGWLSAVGGRASMEFGERSANINKFAFSLLIPSSIVIEAFLKQEKMHKKILFGSALAVILFGIIITGSRGAMLGAGTILIIYLLNLRKKSSVWFVFLLLGAVIVPFIPEFFFERWEGAAESGGAGRLDVWYVSWKALEKYWAFGAGLGNFSIVFDEFGNYAYSLQKSGYASHSLYVGTIIQFGVVGLALMFLAIWKHLEAIQLRYSNKNIDFIMLKAAAYGMLVHSIFIDSIWHKSFWLLLALIIMHKKVLVDNNNNIQCEVQSIKH